MSETNNKYYQLITSLPLLQGRIDSDFKHLTRLSFDKYLKGLDQEDLEMIKDLENLVIWEKHDLDTSSDDAYKEYIIGLTSKYTNKTFLEIVDSVVRARVLLGLFRKRKEGLKESPEMEEYWALPRFEWYIKNNWDVPNFGIKNLRVDLAAFDKMIREDESLMLEKALLKYMWDRLDRMAHGHYFDIDFLLIYAIRRNIVERWKIATEKQDISEKFETLAYNILNGLESKEYLKDFDD